MENIGYSNTFTTCFSYIAILLLLICSLVEGQGTRIGFYARTCPRVEAIVRSAVQNRLRTNPEVAPGLLRMHFHDCFVQGCDGSVLINGPNTEKSAIQNSGLSGYDVIDDVKTQLEAACPGVVSCADILAIAARDSVVLTSGRTWQVPTGRRDGRVSVQSEANALPGFRTSVADQTKLFTDKGLNTQDLVALVGGHTIGTTSCALFSYRLYNTTTSVSDPSINPTFLPQLQTMCPQSGDGTTRVALDTGSQTRFDPSFFTNLINGRGILESDQKLFSDASTRPFVQRLTAPGLFNVQFARSMVKMSNIGVKTGVQGEIRRICSAIN